MQTAQRGYQRANGGKRIPRVYSVRRSWDPYNGNVWQPGEEKERVKMLRRLHEGEVKLGEYAVYCKLQGRVAEWCYLPEEEDEKTITLLPGNTWYYQKDVFRHSIMFRGEINRRKMKPDQVNDVDRRIRAALQAQGYRFLEEDAADNK